MKLSFILGQARSGELKPLSPKDKTDEVVVGYINLALIALYTRFQLRTEEAIVSLHAMPAKTIYTLGPSDSDVKVDGRPMPADDCMTILEVYGENGELIPVNDDRDPLSIYTISYNKIQVPLLDDNTYLSVIYKKNPTLVTYTDDGNGNAAETDVDLPVALLEPMLHYIGYRAHGSVNGDIRAETNSHYMRYEASCNKVLEMGGLTADDMTMATVQQKGYV